MKILIAEDEPSLRENLQWMLELEGYEVQVTCNGQEACLLAKLARPDLILTDVMMPELDGYGLIKAMRSDPATATLPIIMLTAKADRSDVRIGMNLGADDYISKPYRREELLEAIRARLNRTTNLEQVVQRLQIVAQTSTQRDVLTSLPNRELFNQHLTSAIDQARSHSTMIAVVCLGLDGFSKINESLGTVVGDSVLREVAERLTTYIETVRACVNDLRVARIGGDLFAICLDGHVETDDLAYRTGQLLREIARPYQVEGDPVFLSACAGISLYPEQATSSHGLLLNAESALHHAKPCGPGSWRMFDAAMTRQVVRRMQIHNALHQALEQGDLQVFYQPQVHIETGELVGFEALVRWQHATLGWVSPAEFIPIAEESSIIVKLGEWVMLTACKQAAQWITQGHSGFRMAVNLSVRQFMSDNLPGKVAQVLEETGLPAQVLELEITESMALQSVASTLSTLMACKALGVKLAMDDFGTGYSSLAYLKRYPLDALKIDQAFVRNITQDAGDAAITRAIVAMAHSFDMSVIAEGVETEEQLTILRTLGCENFQGYLFSRPLPAAEAGKCFAGYRLLSAQ